jgi:hypothetical protein
MATRKDSALLSLLAAVALAGCAAFTEQPDRERFAVISPDVPLPRAACDTSVKTLPLVARLRNTLGGEIRFNLEGGHPPPYDPWYMGYRVYSGGPGEPFGLVHNSGHDSIATGSVVIPPGGFADFNVPIFGLRPSDYRRYFRIVLRDTKGRAYWTPAFDLCSVPRVVCGCPGPGGLAVISPTAAPAQACPTGPARDACP